MKPKHIKDFLLSEIRSVAAKSEEFCYDPQRDFSRKRKLSAFCEAHRSQMRFRTAAVRH